MAASNRFPLTTARAMRRWKWAFVSLAILVVAVGIVIFRESRDFGVTIPSIFALLIVVTGAAKARRFERLLRLPGIEDRISRYKALKQGSFAAACAALEADGHLRQFDRVLMASPSTWGRRQGFAHFECDPFEVVLYEKNGRLGDLTIFVDDEKTG